MHKFMHWKKRFFCFAQMPDSISADVMLLRK